MSNSDPRSDSPALSDFEPIVHLCDQFEQGWSAKEGIKPRIEDVLPQVAEPLRRELFKQLLAIEMQLRLRAGERPTVEEYRARFPTQDDLPLIVAGLRSAREAVRSEAAKKKPAEKASGPVMSTIPWTPAEPAIDPRQTAGERMTVSLSVTEGPHAGARFTFGEHDMFIVGRSTQAHFRLAEKDQAISRLHFMVEINPPHCRLMDMASTNHTYVNGQEVEIIDLHDGDSIRAGLTTLEVSVRREAVLAETVNISASEETAVLTPTSGGYLAGLNATAPEADALPDVPGYHIEKVLGRGGMGVVYLAQSLRDGCSVALKTVIPAQSGTPGVMARFLREANILRQLDHRNVVRFLEMGSARGLLFFAMEYVLGPNAGQLVQARGPLPVGGAVGLICQALDGLIYAHRKKFVHRDIKPQNLLITRVDGRRTAKLADFGLARTYQGSPLSGLTMTGGIGGTPQFMPPEQVTDFRDAKPAADQYSLGATLYFLLTGQPIFTLPKDKRTHIMTILHEPPVPIRDHRADLPEKLAQIIHRTLEKKPAKRFKDVATLRAPDGLRHRRNLERLALAWRSVDPRSLAWWRPGRDNCFFHAARRVTVREIEGRRAENGRDPGADARAFRYADRNGIGLA